MGFRFPRHACMQGSHHPDYDPEAEGEDGFVKATRVTVSQGVLGTHTGAWLRGVWPFMLTQTALIQIPEPCSSLLLDAVMHSHGVTFSKCA